MVNDFSILEERINYKFKNQALLCEALTHSSYANEKRNKKCNERMEFLGDAVLSIVTAEFLYTKFPDLPEGDLSKLRSALVCTAELSGFANEIGLGDFLFLGKGEENTGGKNRPSILEDAFEALIAAVYLDGGMDNAKRHILRFINKALENHQINFKDYKTELQELVQQNPDETLNYVVVGESGPDHDKRFEVEVHLNSNVIGKGTGKSKKQAEMQAAKKALENLKGKVV